MNKVYLFGKCHKDPVIAESGKFAMIKMFTSRPKKTDDGWVNEAEWHDVKVFGSTVSFVEKHISKGDFVMIEGELKASSWEKDGQKRYSLDVIARKVEKAWAERHDTDRMEMPAANIKYKSLESDDLPF